jgi:hypothetical protein
VSRRRIVLVGAVVALLCAVLLAATARPLLVGWRCFRLWQDGEHAEAELVEKLGAPALVLRIEGGSRAGQACTARTSHAHHAVLTPGARLAVVHRPDRPGDCELEATLANSADLLTALGALVAALVGSLVLAGFAVQRAIGRPAQPTTRLPAAVSGFVCPGCGARMEAGVLVPTHAVHWREVGEPVGLLSILGGLPGTASWRSRACLGAARCAACRVVTFRYGADRPRRPPDSQARAPGCEARLHAEGPLR